MYAMFLILAMGVGGAVDTIPTQRIITTVWPTQALLRRFTARHPQHLAVIIIGTDKK